jgi:hypothetical protein
LNKIKNILQIGILKVTPLTAKLYRGTSTFLKMDPYVKVSYEKESKQTSYHWSGDAEPSWKDQKLELDVNGGEVVISVFDKNLFVDAEIGSCKLNVKALKSLTPFKGWIKLHFEGELAGELYLQIKFKGEAKSSKSSLKRANTNSTSRQSSVSTTNQSPTQRKYVEDDGVRKEELYPALFDQSRNSNFRPYDTDPYGYRQPMDYNARYGGAGYNAYNYDYQVEQFHNYNTAHMSPEHYDYDM